MVYSQCKGADDLEELVPDPGPESYLRVADAAIEDSNAGDAEVQVAL